MATQFAMDRKIGKGLKFDQAKSANSKKFFLVFFQCGKSSNQISELFLELKHFVSGKILPWNNSLKFNGVITYRNEQITKGKYNAKEYHLHAAISSSRV